MREMAEVAKGVYPAPCPFCGSEGTALMDLTDGTGMAWVKCLSCRAEGLIRETAREAVDAWSRVLVRGDVVLLGRFPWKPSADAETPNG